MQTLASFLAALVVALPLLSLGLALARVAFVWPFWMDDVARYAETRAHELSARPSNR